MKEDEQSAITLDYRCKRCGAPFTREASITCTAELGEHERRFHHCDDRGVGIGELIGYHDHQDEATLSDTP